MPNSSAEENQKVIWSPLAGFLSYLIPGLGQIYQGRIAKGILFLVCLYGLFFYGMALGDWSNVYLPDTARDNNPWNLPTTMANIYNRLHYAGQFWIGAVAWPAIYHYANADEAGNQGGLQEQAPESQSGPVRTRAFRNFQKTPSEVELNNLQRNGDKRWDLGWVYTVIAGVLNILVIYDALAGPAFSEHEQTLLQRKPEGVPA